jgi:hypothetical protein
MGTRDVVGAEVVSASWINAGRLRLKFFECRMSNIECRTCLLARKPWLRQAGVEVLRAKSGGNCKSARRVE